MQAILIVFILNLLLIKSNFMVMSNLFFGLAGERVIAHEEHMGYNPKAKDIAFISIALIEHGVSKQYFRCSIPHSATFVVVVTLHLLVCYQGQTEIYQFWLHVC